MRIVFWPFVIRSFPHLLVFWTVAFLLFSLPMYINKANECQKCLFPESITFSPNNYTPHYACDWNTCNAQANSFGVAIAVCYVVTTCSLLAIYLPYKVVRRRGSVEHELQRPEYDDNEEARTEHIPAIDNPLKYAGVAGGSWYERGKAYTVRPDGKWARIKEFDAPSHLTAFFLHRETYGARTWLKRIDEVSRKGKLDGKSRRLFTEVIDHYITERSHPS